MKKGDLVRIVNSIPLPGLKNEDIGKIGIITHDGGDITVLHRKEWMVVLLDGQFQLHAIQNLEAVNEEG